MSKNKFPISKILILVTILAVPGFLYYLLQAKGKNRYKPLPIFGEKIVASTFHTVKGKKIPDTIFHRIPDTQFLSANQDSINLGDFKKELLIVNFFYSRNQEAVAKMNEQLQNLNAEYKDNEMIRFISISIDADYDNAQVLKSYADKIGAKPGKWDIVVADTATVYPLARKEFYVNALKGNNGATDFIFSNQLILLDANHRIRGYYNGTSVDETKRLSDEIKVLITEELRKIKAEF